MPDRGDPSVFIVFQGKYLLETLAGTFSTRTIMLGNTDIVLFQSDVTNLNGDSTHICNLPPQCRPRKNVVFPCAATTNKSRKILTTVNVYPGGEVLYDEIEPLEGILTIPAHETRIYWDSTSLPVNASGSGNGNGTVTIVDGDKTLTGNVDVSVSVSVSGSATRPQPETAYLIAQELPINLDTGEKISTLHLNGASFNICDRWYESEEGATT